MATILFVDDEAIVRRVLGDALRQAGHYVEAIADPGDALLYLAQTPVDLLLLDLQLGEFDGIDLMRQVRHDFPNLPIIILTAHGSLKSAIEAVRLAAADYVLKPVTIDVLRTCVANALAQSRNRHERDMRLRAAYQQLHELMQEAGGAEPLPAPSPAKGTAPLGGGEIYQAGPLFLDVRHHIARMNDQSVELTPTEFAILVELVREPGKVFSCAYLVSAVQHLQVDEEEARQMMRPHIARLRRKLEADPQNPAYIQSVRGIGYKWS